MAISGLLELHFTVSVVSAGCTVAFSCSEPPAVRDSAVLLREMPVAGFGAAVTVMGAGTLEILAFGSVFSSSATRSLRSTV